MPYKRSYGRKRRYSGSSPYSVIVKQAAANERKKRLLEAATNVAATAASINQGAGALQTKVNEIAALRQAQYAFPRMRGRGAYWGQQAGSRIGAGIGGMADAYWGTGDAFSGLGSKIGGMAGDFSSDVFDKYISGRGAYNTNNLINPSGALRPMSSVGDETGDVVISHSEYVTDIVPSSSGFQTQFFQVINPGLPGFAPWLSQLAAFFEEYEMIQCVYSFKSMVTEGNNTAAGSVIMATQYNPTAGAFVVKQNMENYEHANSCKVTDNMLHGIECDPSKNSGSAKEYVRTGPVPLGQDPKTFDLAVVQLATNGATAGLNLGELWVHYTIRLSKAKVVLPGAIESTAMLSASVHWTYPAVLNTGTTFNNPFGTIAGASDTKTFSEIPVFTGIFGGDYYERVPDGFLITNNILSFPQWVNNGTYKITLFLNSSSATAVTAPTWNVVNGVSTVSSFGLVGDPGTGGGAKYTATVYITCMSNAASVTTVQWVFGGFVPAINTSMGVEILQVDSNIDSHLI